MNRNDHISEATNMMTIHERFQSGAVILSVKASVLSDIDVDMIKTIIRSHLNSGVKQLVLDFAHVRHLNSLGIGILLHARSAMKAVKGELRIAGMNEDALLILRRTALNKYFPVYQSVDRALQFQPG